MCEVCTGIEVTAGDVMRARDGGFFIGPALVYLRD
jgi:hypothetical protein